MRPSTSILRTLPLALIVAALAAPPANASPQTPPATTAPTASAVQSQLEIDALNSMTDAMGPMVADAETRLSQMNAFIAEGNLGDAAKAFQSSPAAPTFDGLTFNQAYQVAMKDQARRGRASPSNLDPSVLEAEVGATMQLVHTQWTRLNTLHNQVGRLTSFLDSQGKLDAYHAWSADAAAKRIAGHTPPAPPTDRASESGGISPEQRAANIKKYQDQLAALRQHWDEEHAGYSGPPIVGTPGHSPLGTGVPPGPPPPGIVSGNDFYGGTYWNGYADPYWDVWGYPGGLRPIHPIWNRGGRAPEIAPAGGHPFMGGGGGGMHGGGGGGRR